MSLYIFLHSFCVLRNTHESHLDFLFFYTMICSVKQCVSRTIVASDLFLWKESHSLVPPIPLKKPNGRPILLVSRPLYVSITPVEELSFKWEVSELVAAKKNIIGVYLATWWALQNVFKLNLKQQLNALALSVMMTGVLPSWGSIELVNESDSDIELRVYQRNQPTEFRRTLYAQKSDKMKKRKFEKYIDSAASSTVIIEATNGKCKRKALPPEDFRDFDKLVFNIVDGCISVSKQ